MGSIYQLKTGEFVDLNRIVKIGALAEERELYEFSIIFQLVQTSDKIVISPSHVSKEMNEVFKKETIMPNQDNDLRYKQFDYRLGNRNRARAEAVKVYKKFSEEVYNDLINAWKEFKEEK